MFTATSDSYFIQVRAAMLHLCLGCVLCSLFIEMHAAHAAQPEADPFAPGLDLISIKFAYSDIERIERQPTYTVQQPAKSFNARVGFFGTTDTASERVRFGGTSSLPDYINMEKVKDWVASIRWHMTADDNRASLSPQLRVESKETLLEIKPVDRSVWLRWQRKLD
ncbi:MAG: hypothetical protein WA635_05095 [Gallionella sp.]